MAKLGETWFSAHVEGGTAQFVSIPRDDDGNHIADSWTYNAGDANDDLDISADNSHNGDGLTRYEEYRGVDINGDGRVDISERLNPERKDLFVTSEGFGGDFPAFAYGNAFAEVGILVHQMPCQASYRFIDVLCVKALDTNDLQNQGHIIKQGVREWTFSEVGWSAPGGQTGPGTAYVMKVGLNCWFSDKPYIDGNTWTAPRVWGAGPNGVLDPLDKVEDTDDNGVLGANEKDGNASPSYDDGDDELDGDHVAGSGGTWNYYRDLNPCDVDNDGLIEVGPGVEQTKDQVVKNTITHEMGHCVGANYASGPPAWGNCPHGYCLMGGNPDPNAIFCEECASKIWIHSKQWQP